MAKIKHWINSLYSTEGDIPAINLAVFRLVYCMTLAFYFLLSEGYDLSPFSDHAGKGGIYDFYAGSPLGLNFFYNLKLALIVCAGIAALGIFPRFMCLLTAVLVFVFLSPPLTWYTSKFCLAGPTLLILALNPNHGTRTLFRAWRAGQLINIRIPRWQINALILLPACGYILAAVSKLYLTQSWWNGETVLDEFARVYMGNPSVILRWLLENPLLRVLTCCGVLAFELSFWIVVFERRWIWIYFWTGFALHSAIYFIFGINFFPMFVMSYLIFIDWRGLLRLNRLFIA